MEVIEAFRSGMSDAIVRLKCAKHIPHGGRKVTPKSGLANCSACLNNCDQMDRDTVDINDRNLPEIDHFNHRNLTKMAFARSQKCDLESDSKSFLRSHRRDWRIYLIRCCREVVGILREAILMQEVEYCRSTLMKRSWLIFCAQFGP